MRTVLFSVLFLTFAGAVYAASVDTIVVGRCTIEVAVMETPQEFSKGMLGYTERTFPYGGMLFDMKNKNRKVFHTIGMQMPIRIMGVTQLTNGNYRIVGSIIQAPPGLESIAIDAPDVLEIPEGKFQLHYKKCLGAM